MIFNKSYLSTFSKQKPFLALASKGKILDSKFTLSSELSLYDYSLDKHYPALQTDSEYCKLEWCEKDNMQILACGHTNGSIALYKTDPNTSFTQLSNFGGLNGKVMGIDYNPSKNVIAAGSEQGNIIFWNLDKIDQQYKCDIKITENITSLAWNNKVSRILCAGTECGKILVLDIRAKNIAMTLQNKDIKNISNVKWHPKCSTSIFASTNLNNLVCFKLDSNSMTQIGNHDSSLLNFENVNEDTVVCYSDNKIDYINTNNLQIKESVNVENVFDISFSQKDPIYCCSYNSGTTEVFTKHTVNLMNAPHVQINGWILGKDVMKIKSDKLEIERNESIETEIMDIIYSDGFNFLDVRKKLGELFLTNQNDLKKSISKVDGIKFDLEDKLILNLIKNDLSDVELFEGRSVSLKFVIDLLVNKSKADSDIPLNYLLSLIVLKNYDQIFDISSDQWPVMVAILLYSDLKDDQVQDLIREIIDKLQIPMLNLLINEPSKYFNTIQTPDIPKSVFEVTPFFKKYGGEIKNLKSLNLKYDNPVLNDYFWYAKNHGLYGEIKDIKYEDEIIRTYLNKQDLNKANLNIEVKKMNLTSEVKKMNSEVKKMTITENVSNPPSSMMNPNVTTSSTVPKPSLYPSGTNRSVSSFSTKPIPRPATGEFTPSFSSKPAPPKKSLYSGVLNRSATSFSNRPDSSVSTYGQQASNASMTNLSHPTPSTIPSPSQKPSSIPTPSQKPLIPTPSTRTTPVPNNTLVSNSPVTNTESSPSISYDVIAISKSLEELFENLKATAAKKNNLIVGNKIKDAVRRFTVFQQTNKNDLSPILLEKINEMLELIGSETDKNSIKMKVRNIVDECIEMRNCQSDIWMPAVAILVQLVY